MIKLYDRVKEILVSFPETRDSDKKLIWKFWTENGFITSTLTYSNFMQSPSTESIRRCRQKIQQLHPNLRPISQDTLKARHFIQKQKGTHIFRETMF